MRYWHLFLRRTRAAHRSRRSCPSDRLNVAGVVTRDCACDRVSHQPVPSSPPDHGSPCMPNHASIARPWHSLALGTVLAGALDMCFASGFWWLKADVTPIRVGQSVAAGLLGKET